MRHLLAECRLPTRLAQRHLLLLMTPPKHLPFSFPLSTLSICRPYSCVYVWESVCMHGRVSVCRSTTLMVRWWEYSCFYLPFVGCLSLSCQCCVWGCVVNLEGNSAAGRISNSPGLPAMQNAAGREDTPWILLLENNSYGENVRTLSLLTVITTTYWPRSSRFSPTRYFFLPLNLNFIFKFIHDES